MDLQHAFFLLVFQWQRFSSARSGGLVSLSILFDWMTFQTRTFLVVDVVTVAAVVAVVVVVVVVLVVAVVVVVVVVSLKNARRDRRVEQHLA